MRGTGAGTGASAGWYPAVTAPVPSATGAGVGLDHCNTGPAAGRDSGADGGADAGGGSASTGVPGAAAGVSATVWPQACTSGLSPGGVPAGVAAGAGCVARAGSGMALATRCRLAAQLERSDASDCVSASR